MDIEQWVYRHFDDVLPYGQGITDLRVNCPFCTTEDEGHHLHISLIQETCHCFRCDYANTWTGLIMAVEGCSFAEALKETGEGNDRLVPLYKLLSRRGEMDLHGLLSKPVVDNRAYGMPSDFMTLNAALASQIKYIKDRAYMAIDYITERMSILRPYDRLMERFGEWWGVWTSNRGHGWLVIPVENGWWTSRRLLPWMEPKYLASAAPKNGALYNYAALEKCEEVAIAEGIFSAEFIGDHAIALCGKTATPLQLGRLCASNVQKFEVCLDAGTESNTAKLCRTLHTHGKDVWFRVYAYGDPADSNEYMLYPYSLESEVRLRLGMV